MLEAMGCDPFEGMARLAMDPSNPPEIRGRMYAELPQYIAPKRRAVQHDVTERAAGAAFTAFRMIALEGR